MASDKQKRFRTHVVKELYETEKDYTSGLEFTVMYILEKAKEKGSYDNTFTEDKIQILFCNIEQILEFHRSLMLELSACIGNKGPSYDTPIAQVYLKHKSSFELYRHYGENNEQAQKLLYELEADDAMKAFLIACMLLGGKGDDDISTYIFKPIQRVCKYPLLFRELVKYTPTEHPDYEATSEALDMMRSVCSVINEAKRRVEKLEAIADWQATVEGWEGSNVTDTCDEKIMDGALIKISAGNTQERQFFLFDNLFVYCKKSTILGARKNLLFRGRIPVENLAIENIEDGTADYYTNGIAVSNSWKVQNVAKNKWFVLIAKSHEQKLLWVDAIKRVKENRKRFKAGRASDTRKLILSKGEKIYHFMTSDHVPKDHKVRLKTYLKSFTGEEFIKWLQIRKEVEKVEEGVILGQALLEHGVIHHVNDRHQFKNNGYIYCFRYDDNTFREKPETADLTAQGIRLYCQLHGLFDPLVRDHRVGLRMVACVVMSQRLIDWLLSEKDIKRRGDGVTLGEQLFAKGMIRHITDEVNFKDGQVLYRFTADDSQEVTPGNQRKQTLTTNTRTDFMHITSQSCRTITFPYDPDLQGYGVQLSEQHPITIRSLSPQAQTYGVSTGDVVMAINGKYISPSTPLQHQGELDPPESRRLPPPLFLTLHKTASQHITLVPTRKGLGFHIKGSSPVVISNIDTDSAASQAGMAISSCILKVGDKDAVTLKHDDVVKEIKSSLEVGGANERSVSLKLSMPFMEHVSHYCYEGQHGEAMEVHEKIVESPYVFDIPAQLMRLYAHELTEMLYVLNKAGITNSKVVRYLEDIQKVVGLYKKIHSTLSQPRWPSYKLYGTPQSKFLEACPTNLHTSILGVGINSDFMPQSPSKGSLSERSFSENDDEGSVPDYSRTSYCISTLSIPSVDDCNISKEDAVSLEDVRSRREKLHDVMEKTREMIMDYESLKKMIPELRRLPADHSTSNGCTLSVGLDSIHDDLTPAGSPTHSPVLGHRNRTMSVSNPEPVIKLVAEGLIRKAESMGELLEDRLLVSMLGDARGIIDPPYEDLLARFKNRLTVLSGELKACSKRPGEALVKAARIFVDAIQRHVEELCMHLWISLILCDKTTLLLTVDKLFCQVLTATITAFVQQLSLALRGELNPSADYGDSSSVSSKQWLQLIGKKGVMVHYEATMVPMEDSECATLQGFSIVLEKLDRVDIVLQAANDANHPPLPTSDLPPVMLEGNHDRLKVFVYLPPSQYSSLPNEILTSTAGIKIHTVLFNKGLVDLTEGHEAYSKERTLNIRGLKSIEAYYKKIRAFRLDKSNLPSDSDEKTVAVNKISIPLNAMNTLFLQLQNAVQEPTRPGVGIITLSSELSTRMGAVQVNVCDSGVFRSSLTCSLEHMMVLSRCHALPFKNFRSALNCLRRHGQHSELKRKNQADVTKCLLKEPPKLYKLPPSENS